MNSFILWLLTMEISIAVAYPSYAIAAISMADKTNATSFLLAFVAFVLAVYIDLFFRLKR